MGAARDGGELHVVVADERDRAGRVPHRQVEGEVLGRLRGVDLPLGGIEPPLGVAVDEQGAPARLRLEGAVGDRHRRHGPPRREQLRVDPVAPDDLPGRGEQAVERERAPIGPPLPVRHRGLRLDGVAVARDHVALVRVRVDPLHQLAQPALERRQRRGLDRVDAPLPEREDGDQAGAGQRLQVLRGLRLPEAGRLGELADRPGPLGEELHDAPARAVRQCRCDLVHAAKYSASRIFLSRNT